MSQAIVKIISPVLVDGVWINVGTNAPMELDRAKELEARWHDPLPGM